MMESQTLVETLPTDATVIGQTTISVQENDTRGAARPVNEFAIQPMLLTHEELERVVEEHGDADWIVEGLVQTGSLVIAAGDSGLGKSPLLYQLGLAVAGGVPFLGFKTKQGRVAYLDLENGAKPSKELAEKISLYLGIKGVPLDFMVNLPGYSVEAEVEEIIRKHRPALLIVDSLRDYDPEADTKNNLAATLIKDLRPLARESGTAIVFVHHLRKPGAEGLRPLEDMSASVWLNEVSGARALVNHTDTRIGIDRPRERGQTDDDSQEEVALVIKGFTRIDGEFGPIYVARAYGDDGQPAGYRSLGGFDLLFNDQHKRALSSLDENFSFKDAKRALGKADQSTNTFLKKCESLGLVKKMGRGKYRRICPLARAIPLERVE